jgi:hypothetical protein
MQTENNELMDFVVTAEDVKAAGFCIVPGLQGFLAERGYSLRDFVRQGLPAETLLGFNDPRANRAVVKARERVTRG